MTRKPLILWQLTGLLGLVAVPWYAIEDGFWNFEWLFDGYPFDSDYAPLLFLFLEGEAPWLWPTAAFLAASTYALRRDKIDPAYAVTCDARQRPVALLKGGRPKKPRESGGRSSSLNRGGGSLPLSEMCELQGLPSDFLADLTIPFTTTGKRRVVGNGVPLPMGRAVAKAVVRATTGARAA